MSTPGYESASNSVEDVAAYWLVRLASPECTPEDRYAFEAWKRENPEHGEVYQRLQRGNAFVDRHLADPLIQELVDEARAETRPPVWQQRRVRMLGMAAGLVLAVGAAVILGAGDKLMPGSGELVAAQYETAIGERSTVTLSDGSVVTLNTNSHIDIDFSAAERFIVLARGQAYFEVAKDMDRPFVVEAGDKRVVALGTAFDVRLDDGDVQVTLVEGRVAVDDLTGGGLPAAVPAGQVTADGSIQLHPGERLIAKADSIPEVQTTNAEEETSWRKGQLIFRDRLLADVVAEMNRYSTQQITLAEDPRLHSMEVSGVFNTGRASSFVAALEVMHSVKAERSGRNELTLVWHE